MFRQKYWIRQCDWSTPCQIRVHINHGIPERATTIQLIQRTGFRHMKIFYRHPIVQYYQYYYNY